MYESDLESDADEERKTRHQEDLLRRQEYHNRRLAAAYRHNRELHDAGVTDPSRFIPTTPDMLPEHKQAATRANLAKHIVKKPEDVSNSNSLWENNRGKGYFTAYVFYSMLYAYYSTVVNIFVPVLLFVVVVVTIISNFITTGPRR